ncbi:hypothetical protein JX265_002049 [Neoarthrinium moseri]|uniref:Alpha-ketoglutarate-dependent sulfonate dioxygenase n=1 Tax=Neoarthrinium moseri TaxID=1658444 RepID=A0A9Q0AV66_9PEZI|nr:hypothetical protein JX265_002049 [Neoarthrinium moseri]
MTKGEDSKRSVPDDEVPPAYRDAVERPNQEQYEQDSKSAVHEESNSSGFSSAWPEAHPTVDTCLVHLKLLRAFEQLKSKIGYTDGLWEIWDSRALGNVEVLAKLREKRWALYVARAVDRYQAWWKSFVPDMLTEKDILKRSPEGNPSRYAQFAAAHEPMRWTKDILPPPDVLLVWHTHMLNPRIYLEDCLRVGYGSLWSTGLPWNVIDGIINRNFEFTSSNERVSNWVHRTETQWDNMQDVMSKDIKCPVCSTILDVPWTTCGQAPDSKGKPGLVGQGYGDGSFSSSCKNCNAVVDDDVLRAAKFRDDLKNLVTKDWPMPGTMLDIKNGLNNLQDADSDQLFPNRLVRLGLLVEVTSAFEPGNPTKPSVMFIRDKIQDITAHPTYRHSNDQLKKIDKGISGVGTVVPHRLSRNARVQTRSMMSRYWENSSIFGLELRGAVMRQGVFCEKMFKINWLESPTAKFTMEKLLKKYERFFEILAAHPDQIVTPTLDVDLAWHTHQLSPKDYYHFTVKKTGSLTDHNDKVDEDKLAVSFDWMAKEYQEKYGEVYSECTCWFCESLRFKNASSLKSRITTNKASATSDAWRSEAQGAREPLHISSHPSVHPLSERNGSRRTERFIFHNDLNDSFDKAIKLSTKGQKKGFASLFKASTSKPPGSASAQGSMGPRGQDAVTHWGNTVSLPGPWASQTHVALTEPMYSSSPGAIHESAGQPGVCASGTCGGQGGCGSGAVAMCGAGCTGMGKTPFGPGCAGGA